MRVQDLQIEDKTYKDLFQQQYLADGYNAAQHTLTTPRLASKKMTADKFNEPAADMENLQDDWFIGVVKYVADLVVKFGTNVEYIMQDADEYNDNTQYHLGQVVTYQGSKWICIVDTQITVPPNISGDTWLQVPNGDDGLSGVDFGVSDLYASSQDWDSAKLYSKNDLCYYATTDISNKPIRTMLYVALRANSGINPTSAGQTAWLKIFDQPATKIVISENEPVDKYTGQIWGEKSKMANYNSDGSPYYNLTMHQYNGSSWDNLYPKTTVANVVDGVMDKLITSPLTANSGDVLTYSSSGDTWGGTAPYSQTDADNRYLKLSGGTVTGPLQIAKGTTANSAIRLDEIRNGVAMADGNVTTLDGTASSSAISSALANSLDVSAQKTNLKAIANAIKNKKGSTVTIQASNFATEIRNLPEAPKWQETLNGYNLDLNYRCCAYGGGKYVAFIKRLNYFSYSSDGINWTYTVGLPASRAWNDVCYGAGKFVAVADDTSGFGAYSTDGTSWTSMNMPNNSQWAHIAYGSGKFVAMTYDAKYAAYSTDGITWTLVTLTKMAGDSYYCYDLEYGAGKFIAVLGSTDSTNEYPLFVSSDGGVTWKNQRMENSVSPSTYFNPNLHCITYGNGRWISPNYNNTLFYYSTNNGATWTEATHNSGTWNVIAYGGNKFVIITDSATNIGEYSTDGVTWTQFTFPSTNVHNSICYGAGKFIAPRNTSTMIDYIQDSHATLG